MLPRVIFLYPENTQIINVQGLQDTVTGLYLDQATVTATLFDQRGNPDPVLCNIVLSYVPGTNGNYQGTIPDGFDPAAFKGKPLSGYTLQITTEQAGVQAVFSISVIVQLRSQQ